MNWLVFWGVISVIVSLLIGVDVVKNPQSYRNIGLRFGDSCRHLWFWPRRLIDAYLYEPIHRKGHPVPEFMRGWNQRTWRH
jgi:hypothetical protein